MGGQWAVNGRSMGGQWAVNGRSMAKDTTLGGKGEWPQGINLGEILGFGV
jgi:hypothetical protein